MVRNFFPFIDWIRNYKKEDLSGDLSAGLTVGVMLIPQGMAYSMLAGLPPIYGLYASTIPLILYALFGTSRQLAVGPVAMVALLISSGVGSMAIIGSNEFIGYAILLALLVGVIQFLMGALRLGFLVNFLSHPVIAGFTSAAAIIIGFSQLKHLFGLDIPRASVHRTFVNIINQFGDINWITLSIGLTSIITIVFIKKISKKIPSPLVVVVLSMVFVSVFSLHEYGVKIVKDVPAGLPSLILPTLNLGTVTNLLPIALTISFIGFMESIAVAKAIQAKHKNYEVLPNKELIGLGIANIGGAFFQAFPTTGGFSRTAVNDQAGAKTGLASIISAFLVILTLLFLTEYFFYLPKAVLASIILVAVFGLIDFKEAKYLWKTDRKDFAMFFITAVVTLFIGIEEGIGVGVVLSIVMLVYRVSYPHAAQLGKVPGTDRYRNLARFNHLEDDDEILIMRFDAQLFFANLNYFKTILQNMEQNKPNLKAVIINANSINGLDSSALHMLQSLAEDYQNRNIRLIFAGVKGPVRDILKKANLTSKIGEQNFFIDVNNAVKNIKGEKIQRDENVVLQSNC